MLSVSVLVALQWISRYFRKAIWRIIISYKCFIGLDVEVVVVSHVTCHGERDGVATVNVIDGVPPYVSLYVPIIIIIIIHLVTNGLSFFRFVQTNLGYVFFSPFFELPTDILLARHKRYNRNMFTAFCWLAQCHNQRFFYDYNQR